MGVPACTDEELGSAIAMGLDSAMSMHGRDPYVCMRVVPMGPARARIRQHNDDAWAGSCFCICFVQWDLPVPELNTGGILVLYMFCQWDLLVPELNIYYY